VLYGGHLGKVEAVLAELAGLAALGKAPAVRPTVLRALTSSSIGEDRA